MRPLEHALNQDRSGWNRHSTDKGYRPELESCATTANGHTSHLGLNGYSNIKPPAVMAAKAAIHERLKLDGFCSGGVLAEMMLHTCHGLTS